MSLISRFFSWLFGNPVGTFTTRMRIDGVGLVKIYVFAKGREATLDEMLMVISGPHFKIEGGENSGFNSATEEWNLLPGENEASAIRRVARETADKHPGMAVIAFAWPDTYPTVVAAIVTETEFKSPFATNNPTAVTSFKQGSPPEK